MQIKVFRANFNQKTFLMRGVKRLTKSFGGFLLYERLENTLNIMKILITLSILLLCFAQAQTERPNIVYIIGDDIGWDDLGTYGNSVVQTPVIDELAANGLQFNQFYLTASSCSPSRNSIVTGRYPHNTGAPELHMALPGYLTPYPLLLKEAGYYTAASGKWHMGDAAKRAFDVVYTEDVGSSGSERWIEALQTRDKDKPFFMWLASRDAHRIWDAGEFEGTHNPHDVVVPPFLVDDTATRKDITLYYDEIARFDYYIGLVKDELEAQGVLDNTLIIVMSDNGMAFPRAKTRVYDSGMKSFLVMHWPKGIEKPGSESNSLLSAIDIAPTVLEVTGIDPIESIQGVSFAKLLSQPELPFRNYVFAEHNWHDHEAHERMVRTLTHMYVLNSRPNLSNPGPADSLASDSFKSLLAAKEAGTLTHAQADIFITPRPREELFNCISDPYQFNNVASNPEYQDILHHMRAIMTEWRDATGDDTPDDLTPDGFYRDRQELVEGGQRGSRMPRGVTPGFLNYAINVNEPGPF